MPEIDVSVAASADGWVADVRVRDRAETRHRVRVTKTQLQRYGRTDEDVGSLVRRSFVFLCEREPNTSILREFELATIERYFPDYPKVIKA